MTESPLVRATGIRKSFGAVAVLHGVDIDVQPGEIVALLGENGAGKSTLIKVLSGVHRPEAGTIEVAGRMVQFGDPAAAQRAGIATIHQELSLVPSLTAAENLFLGREPRTRFGLLDRRTMSQAARAELAALHADLDPDRPVATLGVGLRQLVEIAKALSLQARVLILDEPTSALTTAERETLFAVLRRLKHGGAGMIYVSHRLEEVQQLCDRVIVLRDGRVAGQRSAEGLDRRDLARLLVGRDVTPSLSRGGVAGPVRLTVRNLRVRAREAGAADPVGGIGFDVRAGEIVGLAGLIGAGRTATLEALFGLCPGRVTGDVTIDGVAVRPRGPREAIRQGVALVPEERQVAGLVLVRSVGENLTLTTPRLITRGGLLSARRERPLVRALIERLRIKCRGPAQRAAELSGGNQQKVAVGKWLSNAPQVVLVDEPTRGVDVLARAELHERLRDLAAAGAAVLVASSDWAELCELCDRVLVMRQGRIEREFASGALDEAALFAAAVREGAA